MNSKKLLLRNFLKNELDLPRNASLKKIKQMLPLQNGEMVDDAQLYSLAEEFYNVRINEINTQLKKERVVREQIAAVRARMRELTRKKSARKPRVGKTIQPIVPVLLASVYVDANTGFEEYRNIISQFLGQRIIVEINGETYTYDVPSSIVDFKRWIKNRWYGMHDFRANSNDTAFMNGGVLNITVGTITSGSLVPQSFREGETNCMLTPIKTWCIAMKEKAVGKSSKERYTTILNKINMLLIEYANGVPQDKINYVCNTLQINISVELPFQKIPFVSEKSEKKPLRNFRYLNMRHDHVDDVIDVKNIVSITRDEMNLMMSRYDLDNVDYYYTMSDLYAEGKRFKIGNKFSDFVTSFETDTGLINWKIDAIKQPELSKFIIDACHYNCCMDFEENTFQIGTSLNHIDQAACYKNFHTCKYYAGFLGVITDFRFTDKVQGVGIYLITDIVINNPIFKKLNSKMNLYADGNAYASPALKFLDSVGSYKIIGGCWGIAGEVDMDYSTDASTWMDKDNGASYYAKWVGGCNGIYDTRTYSLKGDANTANIIKNNSSCDVYRYSGGDDSERRLIEVVTKSSSVKHLSHVTSFVLEYARLNIIEQLMNMSYSQIVRVNSDGVYFLGSAECVNNYRVKPSDCFDASSGKFSSYNNTDSFCSSTNIGFMPIYSFGVCRDFFIKELAIGAGGCGKTHFNLVDTGLIDVMYIAPTWKLARNKALEYKCAVGTHAGLLGCDITNTMYTHAVYIIDEVSMMSNQEKDSIMRFYSNSKLIFCGDIDYQLPFVPCHKKGVHSSFEISGFDHVMCFNTDYRASCSELKAIKEECRKRIDTGDDADDLVNLFTRITDVELRDIYDVNDMILCTSHVKKNTYTEMFSSLEKYYVTETTLSHSCGEILFEKVEKSELRHAFTVHSIQGETAHGKLFIKADGMDTRMLYTAISRAKRFDQIFII